MLNVGLLLFVGVLGSCFTQDLVLNCAFYQYENPPDYECVLDSITVLNPLANVRFAGAHHNNRTDADVTGVVIHSSNTPFVIPQIFTQFPNIKSLDILNSNLQSIKISPTVQLNRISTSRNNIRKIDSDSFLNQTKLNMLSCTYDNIVEIDERAFDGLNSLLTVVLNNNLIREIKPRHLLLPNLELLNIEWNFLTSIDYSFVRGIPKVGTMLMGGNSINRIHPNAFDGYENSNGYHSISLRMNQCVDGSILLTRYEDHPFVWTYMNELLEKCFRNYNLN